jgi:hypothetical protein
MKTKRLIKNIAVSLISTVILTALTANAFGQNSDSTSVSIYAFSSEPVFVGIIDAGWYDNEFL